MLLILEKGSGRDALERVVREAEGRGLTAHVLPGGDRVAVALAGAAAAAAPEFAALPGVDRAVVLDRPYRLAAREARPEGTSFLVGATRIGGGALTLCAGPCAVETEAQIVTTARLLKAAGADLLRGGAFKPRTSPYTFQGLGETALRHLAKAREETGLPVVTEAVDEASFERVEAYADVVQIGARSMQNFGLLRRAGRSRLAVFLKRGIAARLDDLLAAAEYVLQQGNPRVILCERGIRTFEDHSRFTLDLGLVPAVKERSHLPVFVDPSHATGHRAWVPAMARAAAAAGADGLMLEVHPEPECALSDGGQSMLPAAFASLVGELRAVAACCSRGAVSQP
jgi:3-deoxy-7-phosphoheptulonate synthase